MNLRSYALVTGAYWAFTITDGALRMLVLLHFAFLGYSPLTLAFLFLLYEFFGVLTNLYGGWLGARFGLRPTLLAGLALQVLALIALSFVERTWLPCERIWLRRPRSSRRPTRFGPTMCERMRGKFWNMPPRWQSSASPGTVMKGI